MKHILSFKENIKYNTEDYYYPVGWIEFKNNYDNIGKVSDDIKIMLPGFEYARRFTNNPNLPEFSPRENTVLYKQDGEKSIEICSYKDEWFFVRIDYNFVKTNLRPRVGNPVGYETLLYKCDRVDGLMRCLKDNKII